MTSSIQNHHRSHTLSPISRSQLQTDGSETGSSRQAAASRSDGSDSVSISASAYAALVAGGGFQAAGTYAGYGSTGTETEELTVDEKRSMLADLQSKLSAFESSEVPEEDGETAGGVSSPAGEENPLAQTLTALHTALSGQDLSSLSDEDITSLFDSVSQSIEDSRPPMPPGPPPAGGMEGRGGMFGAEPMSLADLLNGSEDSEDDGRLGLTDTDAQESVDPSGLHSGEESQTGLNSLPLMPPMHHHRHVKASAAESESGTQAVSADNSSIPPLLRAMGSLMRPFLDQGSGSSDSSGSTDA